MHDITCTLNNVMEHIRTNHMYPGKQGKSCFLSTCETTVRKMVEETFLTQMLQRVIKVMRTALFCERNFHGQLVYMEGMEHYVFVSP